MLAFAVSGGSGVPAIIVTCVLMVVAVIGFAYLVYAPTALGRRLLDEVEGLKLYLKVAERDVLGGHRVHRLVSRRWRLVRWRWGRRWVSRGRPDHGVPGTTSMNSGPPGPSGSPSSIQPISSRVQNTVKMTEYGNMVEMMVPMP